jgi:hypothetical protein
VAIGIQHNLSITRNVNELFRLHCSKPANQYGMIRSESLIAVTTNGFCTPKAATDALQSSTGYYSYVGYAAVAVIDVGKTGFAVPATICHCQ